jgi:hypothetical protein
MPAFRSATPLLFLALSPGILAETPAPAKLGVVTHTNTPHLLIREISKPTRAALSYAAFSGNPALVEKVPFGAESLLGEASQTKLEWAKEFFNTLGAADGFPRNLIADEGLPALAILNYLKDNEFEYSDALPDAISAVLAEAWGGQPGSVPAQRLSSLILIRPQAGAAPTSVWAKIDLEPWVKADDSITDNDGDGIREFYLPFKDGVFDADTFEHLGGEYQTEVLAPEEVNEFFEVVLGELYNKLYATVVPKGKMPVLNAATPDLPEIVKTELGTLEVKAPDVVVTTKPHGEWIYNIFLVGSRPGAVTGTPGKAVAAARSLAGPLRGGFPAFYETTKTVPLAEFRTDLTARLTSMGDNRVLQTPQGWFFLNRSLEVVNVPDFAEKGAEAVAAITDLSKKLEAKGIKLVFVPIPDKASVYPERIGGLTPLPAEEPNTATPALLAQLKTVGVATLDLLPAFRKAAATPLFLERDTHWTPFGAETAAAALAEIVPDKKASPFQAAEVSASFKTDLTALLAEQAQLSIQPTLVTAHQVRDAAGQPLDTANSPDSPVLVMGDSYSVIYENQHAKAAGLAAHLSLLIGQPVDLLARQGSGPDIVGDLGERALNDPEYLGKKKLVLWLMTERNLLNPPSAWMKISLD